MVENADAPAAFPLHKHAGEEAYAPHLLHFPRNKMMVDPFPAEMMQEEFRCTSCGKARRISNCAMRLPS